MKFEINLLILLLFGLSIITVQAQNWPFRDQNGAVIRGNITGTVGDYRSSGSVSRFHAGVDFTSPLVDEVINGVPIMKSRAVYSMHTGTAVLVNNTGCLNDWIEVSLSTGEHVFYKHVNPTDIDPVTGQSQTYAIPGSAETLSQIGSTPVSVVPGTFLGIMVTDGGTGTDCEQHVHINANTSGESLEGRTNFIYNFVNPFSDNRAPDFMHPFNSDGAVVTEANGNNTTEFRTNGHRYDNTTTLLNTTVQIDNAIHKVIYDKVDIVSRMRDRKILSNGDGAEQGNNGINSASFELIDATDQSVMLATSNISFSTVPPNERARYIFDDRSLIGAVSRHVYILTGSTHIDPYDRYFNTRLTAGQVENYNLNSRGTRDALCPLEATYKDGKYKLRLRAYHISNQIGGQLNPTIRDTKVVIDNFKPFIEGLIITTSTGDIIYDRRWTWNRATGVLTFGADTGDATVSFSGQSLRVTVWTSESMNNVSISIPTLGVNNVEMELMGTQELRNNWAFNIPVSATQNVGLHQISVSGTDLNTNMLQRNPAFIVKRLAAGGWEGTINGGTDINHSFRIEAAPECTPDEGGRVAVACQVEANFSHAIDATVSLKVNFADLSTPSTQITNWNWEFGDGTTSTTQNPSHTYSFEGEYTVTLTAYKGSEQNSYSKIISVSNDLNPIISSSTTFGSAPLTVEFNSQASTGQISSRSWIISPSSGYSFISGNLSSSNSVIRFNNVGTFQVKLKVFAGSQSAESDAIAITVQTTSGPIVDFDWQKPVYRDVATHFDDKTLFPCLTGIEHHWTFNEPFGREYTSQNVDHAFISVGTWDVTLCVSDGCGGRTCATKSVEVKDPTNAINTRFTADKVNIRKGETVTFYDQSTPRNEIVAWEWLFEVDENHNSGSIPSGYGLADKYYTSYKPSVTHTYNKVGVFKARLYATVDPQYLGNYYDVIITVSETTEIASMQSIIPPSGETILDTDIYGDYLAVSFQTVVQGALSGYIQLYKEDYNHSWIPIAKLSAQYPLALSDIEMDDNAIVGFNGEGFKVFDKEGAEWTDKVYVSPGSFTLRCFFGEGPAQFYGGSLGSLKFDIRDNTIVIITNEAEYFYQNSWHGSKVQLYLVEKTANGWRSEALSNNGIQKFLLSGTYIYDSQIFIDDINIVLLHAKTITIYKKEPEWDFQNPVSITERDITKISYLNNTILAIQSTVNNEKAVIFERPATGWYNNQNHSAQFSLFSDPLISSVKPNPGTSTSTSLGNQYAVVSYQLTKTDGGGLTKNFIFKKEYSIWNSAKDKYSITNLSSKSKIVNHTIVDILGNSPFPPPTVHSLIFYDLTAFCKSNVYQNDNVTITSSTSADVAAGVIILGGGSGTKKVQINNGAVKKYIATEINLKPGFNAQTGSTVSLSLKSCDEINLLTQ